MIFKYIRTLNLIPKQQYWFSSNKSSNQKGVKTKPNNFPIQKNKKIEIEDMNFNATPKQFQKGVKGNIQAQRLLTTVDSELNAKTLSIIITQQREKLEQTLNSYGIKTAQPQQQRKIFVQNQDNQKQKTDQKFYDVMVPLKLLTKISSVIATINILAFYVLKFDQNYLYMGYFLGASLNPSIIFINGIAIGFNCAIWILQQSLHLHLRQVDENSINLIKSNYIKIVQIGSIIAQLMGLGYYLLHPDIFTYYNCIAFSSLLSQLHLIKNLMSISLGKYEHFRTLALINWLSSISLVCLFLYLVKFIKSDIQGKDISFLDQDELLIKKNIQTMMKGNDKFLELLKQKDSIVVAGQKINELLL